VTHYGVAITGMRSLLAAENEFADNAGSGLLLVGGSGALITRNVFSASVALGTTGIDLQAGASGLVLDNTFKGLERGVWATSHGNRIAGNLIVGPPASAGGSPRGITLGASGFAADRNLVEINRIDMQSGCAIQFTPDSHDNVYRINTLRGSGGLAVCNNGTGNVDAGGNVY
jgi:parallel beta helix pectate lyase-like protein